MNKKTMLVLGAGSAVALCNGAYAGDYDLTFTPRFGVGMQKYKLDFIVYNGERERNPVMKVDEYIPTFTLGGSVSMGRFYFDAYVQQTGTSDEGVNTYDSVANYNDDYIRRFYNSFKADRRDYALALGYGFENGLSLFGGYKYGKTQQFSF